MDLQSVTGWVEDADRQARGYENTVLEFYLCFINYFPNLFKLENFGNIFENSDRKFYIFDKVSIGLVFFVCIFLQ